MPNSQLNPLQRVLASLSGGRSGPQTPQTTGPLDPRVGLLMQMPLFQGLRPDTVQRLLSEARIVTLRPGEFFCRQGDEALHMYVLETGLASVTKVWEDHGLERDALGPNDQFDLGMLERGQSFGELALIERTPRSASICAKTSCVAIEIAATSLRRIREYDVDQFILILSNISLTLCQRVREADEKLMRNIPLSKPARTASFQNSSYPNSTY
ncbi:MAG: Crp/Fnr family transcriptional regulator [Leptothrix ochracea]|uniref:Crp/Fnr family transcriptional regulator n=1 Tax=Leptothrix ochracea TaxID=735331 RepID=UPI0034E2C10E